MPAYDWSCLVCDATNSASSEGCAICGCPARTNGKDIAARRAQYLGLPTPATDTPAPPTGHSLGTWVVIALFALGGLQGLWQLAFGVSVPMDAPAEVRDYMATSGLFEHLLRFVHALASLGIAWLLYRLRRSVLKFLWIYIAVSAIVMMVQLVFSEKLRLFWASVGWWPLLASVVVWALVLGYLYRVRAQGRLRV